MQRLAGEMLAAKSINTEKGSIDWHAAFSEWAQLQPAFNSSLDGSGTFLVGPAFVGAVRTFLLEPQFAPFADAIAFSGDTITTSCLNFYHRTSSSSTQDVDALEEVEGIVGSSFLGDSAFFSAYNHIFYDQYVALVELHDKLLHDTHPVFAITLHRYRIIVGETLATLGFAVGAVILISMPLIVHPVSVLISAVSLTMSLACLMGSLPVLDIDLNSVSAINCIMAVGLLVDVQVHGTYSLLLWHFPPPPPPKS